MDLLNKDNFTNILKHVDYTHSELGIKGTFAVHNIYILNMHMFIKCVSGVLHFFGEQFKIPLHLFNHM